MRSTRRARFIFFAGVVVAAAANLLSSVRAGTPPPVVDIWTWGLGSAGQLGPARTNATIPAPMQAPKRWTAVSAGSSHVIALTDTGEVWGWGANEHGELGDGTHTASMLPVQALGLSGVTAIATGGFHSLAYRASDSTLWAWGENDSGQLAQDPSIVDNPVPTAILGLGALAGIAGGGVHSLALQADGTVLSWGSNVYGQLGTGDFSVHASPVSVALPGIATAVGAGGAHSLAALDTGAVYTWGWNVFGQLGHGTQGTPTLGEPVPGPAVGVTGAVEVTGGDLHCLARTSDGHVWAWGYNTEGQVGNGATTAANTGVLSPAMLSIDSVQAVRAGGVHSIALRTNGEVWTWGDDRFGELGTNSHTDDHAPVRSIEIGPAVAVAAGGKFSVALAAQRAPLHVVALGASPSAGGGPNARPAVRILPSIPSVGMVSAGRHHVLALDVEHRVWAWGENGHGQLGAPGPGSENPVPVSIPLDTAQGFVSVAAGGDHSFALRSDGAVWAWGDNTAGQLGIGTTVDPPGPVRLASIQNIVAIAAGERHALAQDGDGNVWGWGENGNAQLGIAASTTVVAPVVIPSFVSPQWIGAGGFHSIAIGGTGDVLVWGAGFRGQLGRSNLGDSAAPVRVTLPGRAVTAAAGRYHTLVLLAGGDVWGFGDNGSCQLGLSPLVYPRTDEPVDLGLHDMLAVAAGEYHSLAVLADHGAVGWGDDAGGQLGRGDLVRAHYDCDAASLSVSNVRLVTGGASSTVLVADDNRIASDGSSD